MNNWHVWVIEQSLDDHAIFDLYPTVKIKSEEEEWKEHIIEVEDSQINEATKWLEEHLNLKWYAHMIKGDEMKVIFKGKSMNIKNGEKFDDIQNFAREQGISEDQLPSQNLFDSARESGY